MEKSKGFFGEFKEFVLRGNMMDMAVGIIVGAAVSGVVNSLVADIIMPIVGIFTGNYNFANMAIHFSETNALTYGMFIQNVISFVIVMFVLFVLIKGINKLRKKEEPAAVETQMSILAEIRDELKAKSEK